MRSITALFLVSPALASGPNLISFPDFDLSTDLTNGYGNLGLGKVWSSVDVDSSSSSGSLLIINDMTAGTGTLVWANCVAVTEGQAYDFGAWYFMQIFQPGSGYARVALQWRESCGGAFIGGDAEVASTTEGVWTQIAGRAVAPAGAGSARIQLVNTKSTGAQGEEREVHFDAVFLPEPGGAAFGLTVLVTLTLLQRWRSRGC